MKKLRSVKERTQNVDVPNDLRGLSGVGLIENEEPWQYLAIEGEVSSEIIEKGKAVFSISEKVPPTEGVRFFYVSGQTLGFKLKRLNLAAFATLVSESYSGLKMQIGSVNTLSLKIQNKFDFENCEIESFNSIQSKLSKDKILITSDFAYQLGIQTDIENEEHVLIEQSEITEILMSSEAREQTTLKKVG